MKIAIWHHLPSGGGKRALHNQVRGLLERGHTLEAWTLDTSDRGYLPLGELIRERVTPLGWRRTPGMDRLPEEVRELHDGPRRVSAMHRACAGMAAEIERGGFDVLFASACRMFAMPAIVRHLSVPTVVYLQEPARYLYETGGSYSPVLPWIGNLSLDPLPLARRVRRSVGYWVNLPTLRLRAREEWLSAQAAGTLLVNSQYSREVVLRTYGRDARVCYLGVDTELFRDLGRPREHIVVGLGSFHAIKGIDLAIESVARLPEPRPRLVWIGNSGSEAYMDQMRTLARERGVQLEMRLGVADAEVVEALNRAALLIYTSRLEPFGFAPLEGNACATPAVAVAEAGVRETVRDGINGFLAERDPGQIAAAMHRLLDDPALARRMGNAAAEHVRGEWGWSRSVECLERHLDGAGRLAE
jgi:glycosyltransferase involved in cell wall biosynthesis